MANKTRFSAWLFAGIFASVVLGAVVGCSAGSATPGKAVGDGNGGSSSGTGGSSTGGTGGTIPTNGGGTGGTVPTAGTAGMAGMGCGSVSCTPVGGTYCGQIGDECGGSLDCGTCTGGWTCEEHICVGGADVCTPG